MVYYYAHSGHKVGLDRVKRGVAFLNTLRKNGQEVQLLVNDFRAGLAGQDWGGRQYVTLETVQDIDAIVTYKDSLIMDSAEDEHGRLVKFCHEFKNVWRMAHDAEDTSIHGEILFRANCNDENCEEAIIVDDSYFETVKKVQRVLFFLGDADYDKTVLSHEAFFKSVQMEMLLGNYFFVKYEDDLAKLFITLHEPEEYVDLITTSSTVVTASAQTAFEARASGAKVIYIEHDKNAIYEASVLAEYGIEVVEGFDSEKVNALLKSDSMIEAKKIPKIDDKSIIEKA